MHVHVSITVAVHLPLTSLSRTKRARVFLPPLLRQAPSPVEAPSESALTTWPTVWIPPSAITGTPNRRAYSATLYTAVP